MKTQLTNEHIAIRKILIRYMADYTSNRSAPSSINEGFYAIHMTDTNMVWLGYTNSFKSTLSRFHSGGKFADCVERAKERGAKLEIWLLTQPKRFSAQLLEDELIKIDRYADRKERDLTGPGTLYCVRHDTSHDYFVLTDRTDAPPTTLMSTFLIRLNSMKGNTRNQALDKFINEQAGDIIKGRGFSITEIDSFEDNDDAWLKRQVYIDECQWGRNLNLHHVEQSTNSI